MTLEETNIKKGILIIEFLNFGLSKLVEACKLEAIMPILITKNKTKYAYELTLINKSDLIILETDTFEQSRLDITICSLQNDYSIKALISITDTFSDVAIYISNKFHIYLPNKEAIFICRRKKMVRDLLISQAVESIQSVVLSKEDIKSYKPDFKRFPIVLKDSSGTSSENIFRVDSEEQLFVIINSIDLQKLKGHILLEEYIEGTLYSAEVIVSNGEAKLLGFSGRFLSDEPLFKEELVSFPAKFDKRNYDRAWGHIKQVLKAVNYRNGFAHIEFILTYDGNINIVEINPRIGGIMLGYCISAYYNYNIYEALLEFALQRDVDLFSRLDNTRPKELGTAQKLIYASKPGKLNGVSSPFLKEGYSLVQVIPNGQYISNTADQNSCVAIAKNIAKTTEEAIYNVMSFSNKVKIMVE